jgi:stringent starvation protein B
MTSNRPYLIRAIFEWIIDNDLTPHLIVDAERNGVLVPPGYAENGRIILNVAPTAVQGLVIGNDLIHFSARFGGVARTVELPPTAVLGIVARENGQGMLFPEEEPETGARSDQAPTTKDPGDKKGEDGKDKPSRPALRIVR